MAKQDVSDEAVLDLAQQIKAEKGVSLIEAMDMAAIRLQGGGEVDCTFHLTLTLKPRVAKFFRDSFSGHPTLTVEERLAAFITMQLNRLRGEALARTREEPEIEKGQAATLRRSSFKAKTGM